ncbi:MAG: c-type cytochrome [bacterium]|nr:c-type cytochrome [bacterium]
MKTSLNWRNLGLPIYLVIGLIVVFGVFFLVELLTYDPRTQAAPEEPLSETAYVERVAALLEGADATNGAQLIQTYGCAACHITGAANNVAPSFVGLVERAAERRPPMPAASYIYESIVNPSVYLVDDYPNAMVQNFAQRITDRELGDILAYLLSDSANHPTS